jgi:xylose isomerase
VWESARGCMRNYLILREKSKAFRADPRVREALAASKLNELTRPTLAAGETYATLREEDWGDADIEALANRGMGFERLDQLAMDHLLGVAK